MSDTNTELKDDTVKTDAVGANVRVFGAESSSAARPSSYGRDALYKTARAALADDAATSRTNLGLGTMALETAADYSTAAEVTSEIGAATASMLESSDIGSAVQAWDAQLDSLSSASANGVSLVTAANYAAMRTLLDLEIGVDVQAHDADLTTLGAGGTGARDFLALGTSNSPQFTGIELGHATDTTLARSAAGRAAVEGRDLAFVGMRNVTDPEFGADNTGVADSAAAFTAADAAGGTVYVGPGTYRLNSAPTTTTASWLISPQATFTGAGTYHQKHLQNKRGMWSDKGDGVNIWRFRDRVFVGDAVDVEPAVGSAFRSWVGMRHAHYLERGNQFSSFHQSGGIAVAGASNNEHRYNDAGYPLYVLWLTATPVYQEQLVAYNGNVYQCAARGTTSVAPTHTSGTVSDGAVQWTYVGPTTGNYCRTWTTSELVSVGEKLAFGGRIYNVSGGGTTDASSAAYPTHTSGSAANGTATLDFVDFSYHSPIGVSAMGYTNQNDGAGAWAAYTEAVRGPYGGTIYGEEMSVRNAGTDVTNDPYDRFPSGSTVGYWIVAGGDNTGTPTLTINPTTCAVLIGNLESTWNAGIVFTDTSITGTDGVTGSGEAIKLAKGHVIAQYRGPNSQGSTLLFNVTNNNQRVGQAFVDGLVRFTGVGGTMGTIENGAGAGVASANHLRMIANAAGTTNAELRSGGSDTDVDLRLNTKGAGEIDLQVGNTTYATVGNTGIRLVGASVGLTQDTTDGSDNRFTLVGGGGPNVANQRSRGAFIQVYGNENASEPGELWLHGGNVITGDIVAFVGAGIEALRITNNNNVVVNNAAIATNATNGFLYVPSCAGTPTGTPTTYTGRVPIVVDTTNNKLYFYSGGSWRDAGP